MTLTGQSSRSQVENFFLKWFVWHQGCDDDMVTCWHPSNELAINVKQQHKIHVYYMLTRWCIEDTGSVDCLPQISIGIDLSCKYSTSYIAESTCLQYSLYASITLFFFRKIISDTAILFVVIINSKMQFFTKETAFLYKIKNTMCGCQWIRKSEHSPRWRAYGTNFTLKSIFRTRTRRSCLYFGLWPGLSLVVVKLTSS